MTTASETINVNVLETMANTINVAPGYKINTTGQMTPDSVGMQVGDNIQNCYIDYPLVPGQHQLAPYQTWGVGTTIREISYEPYTRWSTAPEGSYQVFKLELAGVVLDENFSVDVENGTLICRSRRFDQRTDSTDRIKLPTSIELNLKKITATFRACILEVRIPYSNKTSTKVNVLVIDE